MPASCCDTLVLDQERVASDVWKLSALWLDPERAPRPGQFFMLRCWQRDEGPLLSRPISVHFWNEEQSTVEFLYQERGRGTARLTGLGAGSRLSLTGPLGNAFPAEEVARTAQRVLVVGGGVGSAPLLELCRALAGQGVRPTFACGFQDEAYELERFRPYCSRVAVATVTGRLGKKGFVTSLYDPAAFDAVLACGPDKMMEAVAEGCRKAGTPLYVSLEKRMACGLGACLGCTIFTPQGPRSVCHDGPVFEASQVYAAKEESDG